MEAKVSSWYTTTDAKRSRRERQHAARQAEAGRLEAAFKRVQELEIQLAQVQQIYSPNVGARLAAVAPAFVAQEAVAGSGQAARSSSGLISRDAQVMYTAAKHSFSEDFVSMTPTRARRAQRCSRRQSSFVDSSSDQCSLPEGITADEAAPSFEDSSNLRFRRAISECAPEALEARIRALETSMSWCEPLFGECHQQPAPGTWYVTAKSTSSLNTAAPSFVPGTAPLPTSHTGDFFFGSDDEGDVSTTEVEINAIDACTQTEEVAVKGYGVDAATQKRMSISQRHNWN